MTRNDIEKRIGDLLISLAETDEQYGILKSQAASRDKLLKVVLNTQAASNDEKAISAAQAKAYTSQPYTDAVEALRNAIADYEILRAKRETITMKYEALRSFYSARKQGAMT